MNTADSLLAAIAADPWDDTARLVYADWLEEHAGTVACPKCEGTGKATFLRQYKQCPWCRGMRHTRRGTVCRPCRGAGRKIDPSYASRCPDCDGRATVLDRQRERANFIRVQVGLASLDPRDVCRHGLGRCGPALACPGCDLRRRENALRENCSVAGWLDYHVFNGWTVLVGDEMNRFGGPSVRWRRGFPAEVSTSLEHFLSSGFAARIGRVYGVTGVVLSDREPYWHGRGYCWYDKGRRRPSHNVPESAELPDELLSIVAAALPGETIRFSMFRDAATARESLSRAALSLSRAAAGLAPLTSPAPPVVTS